MVDISPLANLSALRQLWLGANEITDISPLQALTSLESLGLTDNAIDDLSALANLTSLTYLTLSLNNISDISSLARLNALKEIFLRHNAITDIDALSGLTSLTNIELENNDIWDLSALTANAGIGERRAFIVLYNNPIGCAALGAIEDLRDRGARVLFDEPDAVPAAPANLAVELVGGSAVLTWDGDDSAHVFEARHRVGERGFGGWMRVPGGGESQRHEVTGLAKGDHVFEVRGVNGAGCGPAAQVSVESRAELVADAGEDQSVAEERLARLDGGGSSGPEGVALAFSWRQSAGEPTVALTGADTATPSFNAPNIVAPVTLTFELTVTAGGASGSDTVDVTVDADNDPPTARAGSDQTVAAGAAVRLDGGASSDPEGEPLTYSWRQIDGTPAVDLDEGNTATPSFQAPDMAANTTLTFELTVTAGGASGSDTVDVTVLTAFVEVPDAALRRCLLRELGKPAGASISNDDMASLTSVNCPGAPLDGCLNPTPWDIAATAATDVDIGGISRLDGLEHAVNLVALRLPDQTIADLGPISQLWSLSTLRLGNNALADISALGGLTELTELALDGNLVSDIEALSELRTLERVWLNGNEIRNITSLLANESLGRDEARPDGSGDYIDLRGNPLDLSAVETHAPLLRERGAAVLVDDGAHAVPIFLANGSPFGQSFVRVVNRTDEDGEVSVTAFDAAGHRHGPTTLTVGAGQTAQFDSRDLEHGNPAKGLAIGVGTGEGDWRLELRSALEISVAAYARAATGIVASMNATAPEEYAAHHVFTFNPGSNVDQASSLRVVNPSPKVARARIEGVDDVGAAAFVEVTVPAGGSRDFAAAALEVGEGEGVVAGGLGDGEGKWRLRVISYDGVRVLNLMSGGMSGEQLTNLSHIPVVGRGAPRHLPLFPTAGRDAERTGFLRLANNRATAGSVRIRAFDWDGGDRGEVSLAIGAGAAVHLTRRDLANGNPAKGLPNGVGEGRARVELRSTPDACGGNYVRMGGPAALRGMHAFAPRRGGDAGRVVFFNPASNDSTSRLRLVNVGEAEARVSITGIDDNGESAGPVRLAIPAGATRELSADDLEQGVARGLTGALGQGSGNWRLRVESEGEIKVVSVVVENSTGFVENVSR